jgi:hypothetical protein
MRIRLKKEACNLGNHQRVHFEEITRDPEKYIRQHNDKVQSALEQ